MSDACSVLEQKRVQIVESRENVMRAEILFVRHPLILYRKYIFSPKKKTKKKTITNINYLHMFFFYTILIEKTKEKSVL